jgi:hypothetical protein
MQYIMSRHTRRKIGSTEINSINIMSGSAIFRHQPCLWLSERGSH